MSTEPKFTEEDSEIIIKNIKRIAKEKKVKNRDIAKIWNMTESAVSKKMKGATPMRPRFVKDLEDALALEKGTLLVGTSGTQIIHKNSGTKTVENKFETKINKNQKENIITGEEFLEKYGTIFTQDDKEAIKTAERILKEAQPIDEWLKIIAICKEVTKGKKN